MQKLSPMTFPAHSFLCPSADPALCQSQAVRMYRSIMPSVFPFVLRLRIYWYVQSITLRFYILTLIRFSIKRTDIRHRQIASADGTSRCVPRQDRSGWADPAGSSAGSAAFRPVHSAASSLQPFCKNSIQDPLKKNSLNLNLFLFLRIL